MTKRGQFYLIATLVIVGILASMVTVYNIAKRTSEDPTVYDLSSEISYEGSQVINRGIFNAQSQTEINSNLESLTDYYAKTNPTSDLLLIFGDKDSINYFIYNNTDVGSVGLSPGGSSTIVSYIQKTEKRKGTLFPTGDQVQVDIGGGTYNFTIHQGQNFFIIMTKARGSENFVSSPDSRAGVALSPP